MTTQSRPLIIFMTPSLLYAISLFTTYFSNNPYPTADKFKSTFDFKYRESTIKCMPVEWNGESLYWYHCEHWEHQVPSLAYMKDDILYVSSINKHGRFQVSPFPRYSQVSEDTGYRAFHDAIDRWVLDNMLSP